MDNNILEKPKKTGNVSLDLFRLEISSACTGALVNMGTTEKYLWKSIPNQGRFIFSENSRK